MIKILLFLRAWRMECKMIDMERERAAILLKIGDFVRQGWRRDQLRLFVSGEFRKAALAYSREHWGMAYRSENQSEIFLGLQVRLLPEVDGWRIEAPEWDATWDEIQTRISNRRNR